MKLCPICNTSQPDVTVRVVIDCRGPVTDANCPDGFVRRVPGRWRNLLMCSLCYGNRELFKVEREP